MPSLTIEPEDESERLMIERALAMAGPFRGPT